MLCGEFEEIPQEVEKDFEPKSNLTSMKTMNKIKQATKSNEVTKHVHQNNKFQNDDNQGKDEDKGK